jgi:hypothetical protein
LDHLLLGLLKLADGVLKPPVALSQRFLDPLPLRDIAGHQLHRRLLLVDQSGGGQFHLHGLAIESDQLLVEHHHLMGCYLHISCGHGGVSHLFRPPEQLSCDGDAEFGP